MAGSSFEEAAQILKAFAEGEANDRVLELLARITDTIRARVTDD